MPAIQTVVRLMEGNLEEAGPSRRPLHPREQEWIQYVGRQLLQSMVGWPEEAGVLLDPRNLMFDRLMEGKRPGGKPRKPRIEINCDLSGSGCLVLQWSVREFDRGVRVGSDFNPDIHTTWSGRTIADGAIVGLRDFIPPRYHGPDPHPAAFLMIREAQNHIRRVVRVLSKSYDVHLRSLMFVDEENGRPMIHAQVLEDRHGLITRSVRFRIVRELEMRGLEMDDLLRRFQAAKRSFKKLGAQVGKDPEIITELIYAIYAFWPDRYDASCGDLKRGKAKEIRQEAADARKVVHWGPGSWLARRSVAPLYRPFDWSSGKDDPERLMASVVLGSAQGYRGVA